MFPSSTCSPQALFVGLTMGLGLSVSGLACEVEEIVPIAGDDEYTRIPADDPMLDDRLDALAIVCESTFNVAGTFAPSNVAEPSDRNGCWPVGTWAITTVTIDRLGCDPQPAVPEVFVYEVTYDEEFSSINMSFVNDPNNERVNLKISTAGDGLCHGAMEHFAKDGTVWAFNPTLQEDGTLLGIGTYTVNVEDPF